jgi:hypothetical protein
MRSLLYRAAVASIPNLEVYKVFTLTYKVLPGLIIKVVAGSQGSCSSMAMSSSIIYRGGSYS